MAADIEKVKDRENIQEIIVREIVRGTGTEKEIAQETETERDADQEIQLAAAVTDPHEEDLAVEAIVGESVLEIQNIERNDLIGKSVRELFRNKVLLCAKLQV